MPGGKLRPITGLTLYVYCPSGSMLFVACWLLSWNGCFKKEGKSLYYSLSTSRGLCTIINPFQSGIYPHHSLKQLLNSLVTYWFFFFGQLVIFGVTDHSLFQGACFTNSAGFFFLPWLVFVIFFWILLNFQIFKCLNAPWMLGLNAVIILCRWFHSVSWLYIPFMWWLV